MAFSQESTSLQNLAAIGMPVEVDIVPGDRKDKKVETTVSGNVVAYDPDSGFLGLVQFVEGNVSHLLFIPGTSIQEVHDLTEGPFPVSANYVPNDDKLQAIIAKIMTRKAEQQFSDEDIQARFEKLRSILDENSLPYTVVDENSIAIGAVTIERPYTVESCVSQNPLALGKIQKIIGEKMTV